MSGKKKIAILLVLVFYYFNSEGGSSLNQVANEHGRYMKKVYQCRLEGIGSEGPDKYEKIFLDYGSYREVNVKDARKIILDSAQKLLEITNSNVEIKDALANHPYTVDNLHIMISFSDPKTNKNYAGNSISLINFKNGSIYYSVDDPSSGFFKRYKLETYSEALSAVKEKD